MRIGTMFLGKVDALGDESIQTKFFVLGVPLIPVSSHYVVSEQVGGIQGFEIPLNGKSVLLGYVRIYAWLAALLCGVFAYIERRDAGMLWVLCVLFGAAAIATTFGLGRLRGEEGIRRFLLQHIAGVGAPPEWLPVVARLETGKRLVKAWDADADGRPWRKAIEKGEARPLLYAIAAYHDEPDLARRVLEQIRARKDAPLGGPYR